MTIKTLTIDGKEYDLEVFSDQVKNYVALRTRWANDLSDERVKAAKTEAALKALDAELSQLVTKEVKEMAEKSAPAETPAGE